MVREIILLDARLAARMSWHWKHGLLLLVAKVRGLSTKLAAREARGFYSFAEKRAYEEHMRRVRAQARIGLPVNLK